MVERCTEKKHCVDQQQLMENVSVDQYKITWGTQPDGQVFTTEQCHQVDD
jgi:hypothetical protein